MLLANSRLSLVPGIITHSRDAPMYLFLCRDLADCSVFSAMHGICVVCEVVLGRSLIRARGSGAQDPLGLGRTETSLERFTEAELMNGRWAMLGIAGAIGAEVLGFGNWYDAPLWVSLRPAPASSGQNLNYEPMTSRCSLALLA